MNPIFEVFDPNTIEAMAAMAFWNLETSSIGHLDRLSFGYSRTEFASSYSEF